MSNKSVQASKPKVIITDNINEAAIEILSDTADVIYRKNLSANELSEIIKDADALMIRSASKVTPEILAQAPNLKIVGRAGVGTDNIDLAKSTQQGVIVINSPEGNTIAASEHTLGMLFALSRHIPEGDSTLKAGQWERSKLTGVELYGKTLGVIGLGKIGGRVAHVCRELGMTINVFDPYLSTENAEKFGVNPVELSEIWKQSDYISIHAPKTPDTINILNSDTLALCKPGVRIINCARGGIINENDLVKAVESGHVAGIALDVFENEPLSPDSPLLKLGNKAVLTPHLGASTEEAQINVALDVARQIREYFKTGNANNAVNIPTLRQEILDPVRHYMPMAETLGTLARQVSHGAIHTVEITSKGTLVKENTAPLTLAVLKGILSQTCESVNYVNAKPLAESRGVTVKESTVEQAKGFQNLLKLTLRTDKGTYIVAGTLLHDNNFRIVEINGCPLTLEPTRHILFTPHEDKPGMVGLVASMLGNESINISALHVAQQTREQTGESIMVFNLDTPIGEKTLAAIQAQTGISEARYIHIHL